MIITFLLLLLGLVFSRLVSALGSIGTRPTNLDSREFDNIQPSSSDASPAAWQPDNLLSSY